MYKRQDEDGNADGDADEEGSVASRLSSPRDRKSKSARRKQSSSFCQQMNALTDEDVNAYLKLQQDEQQRLAEEKEKQRLERISAGSVEGSVAGSLAGSDTEFDI